MTYTVGTKISLEYLNTNKTRTAEPALSEYIGHLPSDLIPGTRVSFLRMAKGMIVASISEPPMVLSIA